jgi:hypothetical protein
MLKRVAVVVVVAGCSHSEPKGPPGNPPPPRDPPVVKDPVATDNKVDVQLTAVTLADDCGGTPPWKAPPATITAQADVKAEAKSTTTASVPKSEAAKGVSKSDMDDRKMKAKRRCEQTSMQLAITADKAGAIAITSAELFDDKGASIGVLAAGKPTKWNDQTSAYEDWDQKVGDHATAMVSYVLAQPDWSKTPDRWDKTYTLKVVVHVGDKDQKVEKAFQLEQEASLPPNVKT